MQLWLLVIGAAVQLAVLVLGAYVAHMNKERRPRSFAAFVFLGLVAFAITVWMAVLTYRSGEEFKKTLQRIADKVEAYSGRPVGEASLAGIEQGIAELKTMVKPKPWWLTPEQISLLAKRMAPFADGTDRTDDLLYVVIWDQDSSRLVSDLASAFRAAGWKLGSGFNPFHDQVTYRSGLHLMVHSQTDQPRGLNVLAKTLEEGGIPPILIVDESVPPDRFGILVGARPAN